MPNRFSQYSNNAMTVRNALLALSAIFLASGVCQATDKHAHHAQAKNEQHAHHDAQVKNEQHAHHDAQAKNEQHAHHTRGNAVKTSTARGSRWGRNYFPNTKLVTQDGETRLFFDDLIKDKVVVINFIFTSCTESCPLETARMRSVYEILGDRVGKDIFFYSISIDPETDTPEVLKAYMEKFKLGPGWTFLTGNEQEIIELRKKLGLYIEEIQNDKDNPDDHNISLVIGNQASGRWMKRSPFENPYVLASQLGQWLHNWKGKPALTNSYANAPQVRQISSGETLFRTRCSSCHDFGKDGVGPDLLSVAQKRDRGWLIRWLKEPDIMLAAKDPLAMSLLNKYKIPMPNLRLTDIDVDNLISFMESEDKRLR